MRAPLSRLVWGIVGTSSMLALMLFLNRTPGEGGEQGGTRPLQVPTAQPVREVLPPRQRLESPKAMQKPSRVGEVLDEVIGDGKSVYQERLRALKKVIAREGGMEAMLEAAERRGTPEGLGTAAWHGLVDEIFTAARQSLPDQSELARRLSDVALDPTGDLVVRDYALQHLGHMVEKLADPIPTRRVLERAVGFREGSLAGTALLALSNIERAGYAEPPIADLSSQVMLDGTQSEASRITAAALLCHHASQKADELGQRLLERAEDLPAGLREILERQRNNVLRKR